MPIATDEARHPESQPLAAVQRRATLRLRRRRSVAILVSTRGAQAADVGPRGQQLQQLLILLRHGDSHVVKKIFKICTD